MTRFVYLLLILGLSVTLTFTGCAGEDGGKTEKGENAQSTDDDSTTDESDATSPDDSNDSEDTEGDTDTDLADATDDAGTDATETPAEKKTTNKQPKSQEEDFEEDFEFDDDLDDVFDTSPDPDPNVFVKVDKEPVFKNEDEVRALVKAPYAGAKGKVYAKVLVGLDGRYRQHYIRRSPDRALSNAVANALKSAVFTPARKDGQPKKVWVDFFYEFK